MRGRTGMTPLVVESIVRETPSIVSLTLADPSGAPLPAWEPGSHLDVQLITRHERQYSLCGDPTDVHRYRIAVRREEFSRGGSHYIHTFLRPGGRVWVRPPRNMFTLGDADRYLLLAAGIGITPILSMARHLDATGRDWRMIVLSRTRDDVPFGPELAALGDRVRVHLSSEMGRHDLARELGSLKAGTDVYACGPQGFIDALDTAPIAAGCRLHVERFSPKPREALPNAPFTVACTRSDVTVEVAADQSMLHALQGAGVAPPASCLRGVCGSCALTVLEGTPEHRDSLTADDEARVMYPCVSRVIGDRIAVDA
jgi:ferredoxin-NADP reductase